MTSRIAVTLFGFGFTFLGVVTSVSSTATALESTDVTSGCARSSWIAADHSCYLYVREKIDFYQAKESCQTLAADLVTINSAEENQFIREFVVDLPVWIGLYRTTNATCAGAGCVNWMWLDGSKEGYVHWWDGLPTTGQCAYMTVRGDWWHGVLCSTKYGYVCEQKPIIPTTKLESTTKISASEMTSSSDHGSFSRYLSYLCPIVELSFAADNDPSTTDSSNKNDDGSNMTLIIGCVIGGLVVSTIDRR